MFWPLTPRITTVSVQITTICPTSYIEENKLYIRLASNDMFRISRDVVQMILNGEVQTAQEALTAFNNELAGEEPGTQIVAHIHPP